MAINPPSDLILDVARAADPAAAQAAAERLRAMSLQKAAGGPAAAPADVPSFDVSASVDTAPTALRIEKKPDAYSKFESFVLQTFIQSMFAGEEDADVFGKGASGQYWKSMLAGAIADNMAQSGGIGVARMLRAEADRKKVAAATQDQEAAAAGSLALPSGATGLPLPRASGPNGPG
jgi:peptidoglycan hydrolase FlgJ